MIILVKEKCLIKRGNKITNGGQKEIKYKANSEKYEEAVLEYISNKKEENVIEVKYNFYGEDIESSITSIEEFQENTNTSIKENVDDTVYRLCEEDVDIVLDDSETLLDEMDELNITKEEVYNFVRNKMEIPWTEYVEACIDGLIYRVRNSTNK